MLINQAEKIYLGNQEAQKVYLGNQLVWELQSESTGSEAAFTLVGKHFRKVRKTPYIRIRKQGFENFGVDPFTVNAITVNGERYDVTKVRVIGIFVDCHIENADSLELNERETLTIHYLE